MLLLLSRAARRRKSFQERTRYKTLIIFFFFWMWTFVRLVKISSRSTFPPLSLFVVRFFCALLLFSASFCFFFVPHFLSSSQVIFHTTNREREREKHNLYTSKTMMMHSCSARTPPTVVVENTKVRYCFFVVSNSLFALSLSSFTSSSSLASTRSLFCLGEILFG